MGNTYVNLTVLDVGIEQVRDAALASYIGAVGGDVVVYALADEEAGGAVLGEQVTGILGATGITVGVMDDDILVWTVHRAGVPVASGAVPDPAEVYGSIDVAMASMGADLDMDMIADMIESGAADRPGAGRMIDPRTGMPVAPDEAPTGGGDPAADLVAALGRGDVDAVRTALATDRGHVMATDRHVELVAALGLPAQAVGWGHRYIAHAQEAGEDLEALGLPPLEHIS